MSQSWSVILWNMTSGGIDDGVQSLEDVHGLLDHPRHAGAAGDGSGIGDRLAARGLDLARHHLGRAGGAFVAARDAPAQCVAHHAGAFAARQQRTFLADAVGAARDQNDLAFQHAHGLTSARLPARSLAAWPMVSKRLGLFAPSSRRMRRWSKRW